MSSVQQKYRTLLKSLFAKTEAKKIDWEFDWEDELFAQIGRQHVYLKPSRDSNAVPREVLTIQDGEQVIDSFNDVSLGEIDSGSGYSSYYFMMRDLRNMAARQARGADDALDTLISELSKD